MPRPLIISDCDEVLLHMVVPFAEWVDAEHGVAFRMEDATFANALKRKECGTPLAAAEVWPLLDGFFMHEMGRQTAIPGAAAALARLSQVADIVILTNVGPEHQAARTEQLVAAAMPYPVIGSRGPKGPRVAEIVAARDPSLVVFIDDLGQHHHSVADAVPAAWRLHFVGEPAIADKVRPSRAAHARIDTWAKAEAWIADRIATGVPAEPIAAPATP